MIYVYIYGWFGWRGLVNFIGDGIFNFFIGEDVCSYYCEEFYKVNVWVFKIDDIFEVEICLLFENFWNLGVKLIFIEKMGERIKFRERVIDVYDLIGSNCIMYIV